MLNQGIRPHSRLPEPGPDGELSAQSPWDRWRCPADPQRQKGTIGGGGGGKLGENDKEEEERQEEMGQRKTQGTTGLKKDTKAWDLGTHTAGLSHI